MATTIAQLSVKIDADVANAEKGLKSVEEKTGGVGGKLKGLIGQALPIAGAFAGVSIAGDAMGILKDQIADAFTQAEAAQQIQAKLNAELRATHDVSGQTTGSLNALADGISQVTTYDDDAVRSAEGVLLQFTNIGKQTFPAATKATADLASGLGTDLPSAAGILGRALDNPLQASRSLRQAHITLTTAQSNLIKQFEATGNKAGAQGVILDAVKDRFGGLAKAAGETTAGKITIFQNRLDDAKKGLATAFLPALAGAATAALGLVDKISGLVGKLGDFVGFLQAHQPLFDIIKAALAGIGIAILISLIPAAIALVPAFIAWAVAAGAAALATLAVAAPIIGIGLAIGALILGIKLLIDHGDQVKAFFGNILGALGGFFGNVLGAIGGFVGNVVGAIAGLVGKLIGAYIGLYARILGALAGFVGGFLGVLGSFAGKAIGAIAGFIGNVIGAYLGLYAKVLGIIGSLVGGILGAIGNMAGRFLGVIGGLAGSVLGKIGDLVGGILGFFGGLSDKLYALGKQLIQNLINGIGSMAGAVGNAVGNVIGNIPGASFLASHIPGHASGGITDGGLFMGAEEGPELLLRPGIYSAPRGSRVLTASQTRDALSGSGASSGGNGGGGGPAIGTIHIHGADADQVLSLLRRESTLLRMAGRI